MKNKNKIQCKIKSLNDSLWSVYLVCFSDLTLENKFITAHPEFVHYKQELLPTGARYDKYIFIPRDKYIDLMMKDSWRPVEFNEFDTVKLKTLDWKRFPTISSYINRDKKNDTSDIVKETLTLFLRNTDSSTWDS